MGSGASSLSGPAGPASYFPNVSKYNPFGSSTPAPGPTQGNAYTAQNNATKAANNAAKVAKNAANAKAANNATKPPAPAPAPAANASANAPPSTSPNAALASSTGAPRIERVSSRMNGGKPRKTRKKSRKNRR